MSIPATKLKERFGDSRKRRPNKLETKPSRLHRTLTTELSDGSLNIKVFHGGSLNLKDNDVVRWLPGGAVQMGLVWANYLGRDAPALSAVLVQGSVGSSDELLKVLPTIQEIYKQELDDWGIETAGFMALPLLKASIFCRDEPVRTLDDLKKKKVKS